MALHRILKSRKTGKEIHARPADRKMPLATVLTEEREFDISERELTVDEARAINGLPTTSTEIRASAADAQAVMRAKLEELGFKVDIIAEVPTRG